MTPVGPATAQRRILASRETVWAALEEPYLRHAWWPETQIDFEIGGSVSEAWREGDGDSAAERNAHGAVDVLMRGHALGFRWQDAADDFATEVLITLRSYDGETGVVVSETGFGRFPDAAARVSEAQQGWAVLLEDLAKVIANPPEAPAEVTVPAAESYVGADDAPASVEPALSEAAPDIDALAAVTPESTPLDVEAEAIELPGPNLAAPQDADDAWLVDVGIVEAEVVDAEVVEAEVVEAEVREFDIVEVEVEEPTGLAAETVDIDVVDAEIIVVDAEFVDAEPVVAGVEVAGVDADGIDAAEIIEVDVPENDSDSDSVDDEGEDEEDEDDDDELLDFDEFIRGAFGDDATK